MNKQQLLELGRLIKAARENLDAGSYTETGDLLDEVATLIPREYWPEDGE